MNYQGSCHCGNIRFEVEGTLERVTSCNCSYCQRKGALMWFVPRDKLALTTPESTLSTYTFNKHVIQHRFCAKCACSPFGEARDPKGNLVAAVNVRCLEDIDLDALPVDKFDGRNLL